MSVQLHHIADVLAKRSLRSSKDTDLAREIAAYLLETGRTGELNPLARDLVSARARLGTVELTIVSAHTMDEAARAAIRTLASSLYPKAEHIVLNERIEPDLIGGARVEFPDQQLDMSIRAKLNRFKALTSSERTN